jgi:hypothetical protein
MKPCLSAEEHRWLKATGNPYATLALGEQEYFHEIQIQASILNEALDCLGISSPTLSPAPPGKETIPLDGGIVSAPAQRPSTLVG